MTTIRPRAASHSPTATGRLSPILALLLALHGVFDLHAHPGDDCAESSFKLLAGGIPSVVRSGDASLGDGHAAGQSVPGILNGAFDRGLAGWAVSESGGTTNPGSVLVSNGRATLREGDSFLVTLSQRFLIPSFASTLSFDFALDPGFDTSEAFIPDAFEVSLLDAELRPVLGAWDPAATSSLNIAEDGTARTSDRVTLDGTHVTIDLSDLPAGLELTLYFDFIGADADTGGEIWLDSVAIETTAPGGVFVRGEANGDEQVDISDPVFTLNFLFLGGAVPRCLDALDSDNTGDIVITDPIYTLNFLFLGGPRIPEPYPLCGEDTVPEDSLGCDGSSCVN